jgi:hypothetical protein
MQLSELGDTLELGTGEDTLCRIVRIAPAAGCGRWGHRPESSAPSSTGCARLFWQRASEVSNGHLVTYPSTPRLPFMRRFLTLAVLVAAASIASAPAAHAACAEPPIFGGPAGNAVQGDPSTVVPPCMPNAASSPNPNNSSPTQTNPSEPDSLAPVSAKAPTSASGGLDPMVVASRTWVALIGLLIAGGLGASLLVMRRGRERSST